MPDPQESARLERLYEQLRERLLDMSLRNPMLSYKHRPKSKRQLRIVDAILENVYGQLTDGQSFEIVPLREPEDRPLDEDGDEFVSALAHAKLSDVEYLTRLEALESTGRDDAFELAKADRELRDRVRASLGMEPRPDRRTVNPIEHARSIGIDPSLELTRVSRQGNGNGRKKLQTLEWPDSLESILDRIFGDARLAEQETGLSTLFLAFGFLEWRESDESEKPLFAPVLLLPVKLERNKSARGRITFSVSAIAESADPNISLQKKLDRDFALRLPKFVTSEESSGSVDKYLVSVSDAVKDIKDWKVRRFLTLGHFSFGRFAMYADLAAENWGEHPVADDLVGAIVRGTELAGDGGSSLFHPPDDYAVDDPEIERIAPILIHDADASQHSALVDVMKEKHLVIQGPPGTGKSQTITNIIANALAVGKTVLFLAEKQAALEVVSRRLGKAELGHFCLELHSEKATPRLIVESLKARAALRRGLPKPALIHRDVTWDASRREVGAYVAALNVPAEDGQAPFDLIWRTLRARSEFGENFEAFGRVPLPTDILDSPAAYRETAGEVSIYSRMAQAFIATYGRPAKSSWRAVTFADPNPGIVFRFIEGVADLRARAEMVARLVDGARALGVEDLRGLQALDDLHHKLPDFPLDPTMVSRVAALNAAEIEGVVWLRSTLRVLDARAADIPELAKVSADDEARIGRLAKITAGTRFAGLTPAALYYEAAQLLEIASKLLEALGHLRAAMGILRLGGRFPVSGWQSVLFAAFAASGLSVELKPWFCWHPHEGEEEFDRAYTGWTKLVADEAYWRGRFPGYREPTWPNPDELRAASTVARKGGIAKLFGAVGGGGKVLATVSERLGVPAEGRIPADDLDRLAAHARAVATFLNNHAYRQMLGESWKGLSTPFPLIAKALHARRIVYEKISERPQGDEVIAALNIIDPAGLERLAEAHAGLRTLAEIHPGSQALDDTPLERKIFELEQARDNARITLDVDPDKTLTKYERSVVDLGDMLRLEAEGRKVRSQLAVHPLAAAADELAGSEEAIERTRAALAWASAVKKYVPTGSLQSALLSDAGRGLRTRIAECASLAATELTGLKDTVTALERDFGATGFDRMLPRALADLAADLQGRRDELSDYLSLHRQRALLRSKGLGSLLETADTVDLEPRHFPSLFSGLVSRRRAETARRTDRVLAAANGLRIEARRQDFIDRDREKIATDRVQVKEALMAAQPPSGVRNGPRSTWTEMELLHNEFGKEKRFVPVRDLMQRAGAAIQALTPCFMMSPLSLAKFLSPNKIDFDLVVIDEASQMRPEDALGGLLRARQLVVVGDQKQLPPTDFFSRSADGGTDGDEFEDLDDESILEACQKTFRQTRLLRWHYRSRCESLISFSNREFYKGELITFPMAKPGSFSIDLIRVNGTYEASRNPAEAQAVAEEAMRFMRRYADDDQQTLPTLGIAAVNSDQRDLLMEEVRRLAIGDELVERYQEKVAQKGEPLFVKNLENVQGDERDFIFISMTYGPAPGQMAVNQRFGPINSKQGHRRLNVLFSRARIRIGLFTSFGSNHVVLTDRSSAGVHVLKRYLEYAEKRGLIDRSVGPGEAESDFEAEVAHRLRSRGYTVDPQVGVSGYRIDLGVRHPKHPERYLAGIECDGARYHSTKSARDRDRLREEVLRGLGWDIVRVWSTDWFDNPDQATERLIKRLVQIQEKLVDHEEEYRLGGVGVAIVPDASDVPEELENVAAEVTAEPIATGVGEQGIAPDEVGAEANLPPSVIYQAQNPTSRLNDDGPLTKVELHAALRDFRDTVITAEISPWQPHRSILREAMIETFVEQRLDDPGDWHRKVPMYLRQGTNPAERSRFLDRLCDIVGRLEGARGAKHSKPTLPPFELTAQPQAERRQTQFKLFDAGLSPGVPAKHVDLPESQGQTSDARPRGRDTYVVADVSAMGLVPDERRFYEPGYRSTLSRMVAHVIEIEGPVYIDQVVTRIARAHGFLRNGPNIVEAVERAIDRRFARTREVGRELVWPAGKKPEKLVPFRKNGREVRPYTDIPLVELASLAAPVLARRKGDEEILDHMRHYFGLERLREPARIRFEAAIRLARRP
jgi:very-short-patch-repair endonuclease